MEKRLNKRYQLNALVIFTWESFDGDVGKSEGCTRDISLGGVFVNTAGRPGVGSLVRMDVTLPPLREKGTGPMLSTKGRVVRAENQGFAAVADIGFQMEFRATQVSSAGAPALSGRKDEKDKPMLWPGVPGWVS